jgi:hypothetical protein
LVVIHHPRDQLGEQELLEPKPMQMRRNKQQASLLAPDRQHFKRRFPFAVRLQADADDCVGTVRKFEALRTQKTRRIPINPKNRRMQTTDPCQFPNLRRVPVGKQFV